ncbi:transcription-repair coupling factor [Hallella multisaccharivorax DSM 17128]|uniref:Transcription-repair-coupling factor n=1 Tax=Hallella multisaccharivorax DSM 17128 TaxID=688246 RepID=F8NCN1_9BACT|nr:transcription-repair coupling factor [Hallella multisaccharivorax]EGN57067.1 transcription-repair coupling factor [Hallella multisaccharivorax DSM 17128]
MRFSQLVDSYGHLLQAGTLLKTLGDQSVKRVVLQGLVGSSVSVLFSSVFDRIGRTILFILDDADEAGYFFNDLSVSRAYYFPSAYRRAVKYGQRDAANEISRTETLASLSSSESEPLAIVASPQAMAELVVSQHQLDERRISLKTSQLIAITDLEHRLRDLGFTEVDYVYEPGQFALRGSIVDVYSYSSELPYRIDFFGDEIDTIRTFSVEDQLSQDRKTQVEIVPELASLETEKVSFLHFLPDDALIVMKDERFVFDMIQRIYNEGFSTQAMTERMEGATELEQEHIRQEMNRENVLCKPTVFADELSRFQTVSLTNTVTDSSRSDTTIISFHTTPQPLYHKNFDLLRQSLEDYQLQGYHLYILADSEKQQQRLRDILNDMTADDATERLGNHLVAVDRTVHEGFVDGDLKACFFTDHQIFDRFHKYNLKSDKARAGKMALTMKELQEMQPGDYLVHVDLGIGKFGGLIKVPNPQGGYQEVIRIIYQNNDKVDVSIHSLYKISKYRAADSGKAPHLSTLGTGAWERLKERTKKKIKDIARDLIRLYAKRRHEKGFAFSPDNFMQHELEASFLYEDTPDQLKATQDIKADMERAVPMDRLVCGDVGFGKTELAIRAAFKAACDGKQTALLVPTTVLAYQHYQTFKKRLRDFPVTVEYLSRARTAKQARQVTEGLESGRVDIIIGTHKLIGKSVKWHDLGLLIIDEEQKFGVSTKEKLRKLKTNVDTLTMSATPIPRTLQFSLMGARDMSIMRTPPPNRYPIHTELCTFSHEVIADAINFEMSRSGQVFFVSDRISGLTHIAELIHQYVPDCRVAIGYGQMPPENLEKIIMGFINYEYDVLLSTTIVENGVDIPNANTIIINDAHHFGLSDLHQMRGRVGRSNRKAFCYLLAPPRSSLTPEARRRLEALETFSDLGSGFSLAMQDLDIRGAGNLLGSEQSGFMEDLGYETYQKILSQAVTELKNDEFQDLYTEDIKEGREISGDEFVEDCAVESDLPMFFPDTYVPTSSERMLLYRELDNITDDEALKAYRQRLVDRFGSVPHEGEELMQVVMLRRFGRRLGCEKIMLRQSLMTMQFVSNQSSAFYQSRTFGRIIHFVMDNPRRCNFKDSNGHRLIKISNVPSVAEAVTVLRNML